MADLKNEPLPLINHLFTALSDMDSNLAYVLDELPGLGLPEEIHSAIARTCEQTQDALHDISAEVHTLAEKLGLTLDDTAGAAVFANAGPMANLELIERWTGEVLQEIDRLARRTWELAAGDVGRYTVVSVLVTESAANLLQASARLKTATGQLRQWLAHRPAAE